MPNSASQITPTLTGGTTDALVYEQGITYDQAGITYDNVGIAYGGIYNTNEDVIPMVSLAEQVRPTIFGYSDMYSPFIPDPDKGMLIGPGLPWQFLTYP